MHIALAEKEPQRLVRLPVRYLAGGLGAGALLAAGFPPYGVPFLLPLGVAALLAVLRGRDGRTAVYAGLACGAVYFGGTLFWLGRLFGAGAVALIAIETAYIGAFGGLYAGLQGRLPRLPAWLLAPVTWTALEYARSELMPLHFGWMGLGYGIADAPALMAAAAWVGTYGLTFGIVALGALLSAGPTGGRGNALRFGGMLAAWGGLLLLPRPVPVPARPLAARLVQAGAEETETLLHLSQPAPGRPADVVVWPEYSFMRDPREDRRAWTKLQETARANRSVLVFGGEELAEAAGPGRYYNTAFVLGPDGRLLGRHHKNHPVHLFNDGTPGRDARAIDTPAGRLGVAICFDMDYPDTARRLAQDGAEVFLVPNMDAAEWGPVQRAQHRLMFQMRAAECGRWLARADVAGGTSAVARTGRETARVRTSNPAVLEVVVGRETGRTLYVRGGWRFPQACLLALGLLILLAMRRPSRGRTEETC